MFLVAEQFAGVAFRLNGAAGLGIDLDEYITFCVEAMKTIAERNYCVTPY